jgi:hypothetical protein
VLDHLVLASTLDRLHRSLLVSLAADLGPRRPAVSIILLEKGSLA